MRQLAVFASILSLAVTGYLSPVSCPAGISGPTNVGYGELVVISSDTSGTWDILHPPIPFRVSTDGELVFSSGLLDAEVLCVFFTNAHRGELLKVVVSGDSPPKPSPDPRPTPRPEPPEPDVDTDKIVRNAFAGQPATVLALLPDFAESMERITAIEGKSGQWIAQRILGECHNIVDDAELDWDAIKPILHGRVIAVVLDDIDPKDTQAVIDAYKAIARGIHALSR